MDTLENDIAELLYSDKLRLFKEAEEFRAKGVLPLEAFSRTISKQHYNQEDVLSLLRVHNEVYRQLALAWIKL